MYFSWWLSLTCDVFLAMYFFKNTYRNTEKYMRNTRILTRLEILRQILKNTQKYAEIRRNTQYQEQVA